jgi:hypothetical protein
LANILGRGIGLNTWHLLASDNTEIISPSFDKTTRNKHDRGMKGKFLIILTL